MIALFQEDRFPTLDTAPVRIADLRKALASLGPVESMGVEELSGVSAEKVRLVVLPYGSAFPRDAWRGLLSYLQQGGNLLVLGGRPFERPVSGSPKGWVADPAQTAFYQSLAIEQIHTVTASCWKETLVNHEEPWLENLSLPPMETHSLMVRLTDADEDKGRTGTVGPMSTGFVPLAWGVDASGRRMACPAVMMEQRQGAFEGGRWVFAPCHFKTWGARENEWAVRLAACALVGALEAEARPALACYNPGAQPDLSWWVRGHRRLRRNVRMDWALYFMDAQVAAGSFGADVTDASRYGSQAVGIAVEPGFYRLETRVSVDGRLVRVQSQGFWGWDESLVEQAPRWGVSGDQFRLDGRDMSVVGTTYMAGDVSRKFVTHPNPAVWDRDFAEMKADGINLVRTGFWAMHRQIMLDSGRTREDVLRAMDAFVLTALKHRIPVVFNFFSFIPDAWPSDHPYLDPRALAPQREFMLSFVDRYARIPCVGWDFINEPSMNDPQQLWKDRPLAGERETRAFRELLRGEGTSLDELRRRWNMTPEDLPTWEAVTLPRELDFSEWISPQEGVAYMGKAFDFHRYAQKVFADWSGNHVRTLKKISPQTFCVGQDGGGVTGRRPNNHSFHEPMDYVCNHVWWENEDLLFSVKAAAVKGKPFLVQETGIMFTNELSRAKRCKEDETGRLFERKLASSFMSGSGFIQWCWNINALMNERNEVEIGAHRADRTTRPEGLVLEAFGAFFKKAQDLWQGPLEEPTLAVVESFTGLWSNRSHTDLSQRASHWALGALGVPFTVLGEGEADRLTVEKTVLFPSVQRIDGERLRHFLKAAGDRTLLVSGPLAQDGYGRPHEGLSSFGVKEQRGEVAAVETLDLGKGREVNLNFSLGKPDRVDKDRSLSAGIHAFKKGKTRLFYQPVPVEAGDSRETLVDFYRVLLAKAGVKSAFRATGTEAGDGVTIVPRYRKGLALYVASNEGSRDRRVKIEDVRFGFRATLDLPAGRATLALFDLKGRVLAAYQPPKF